MVRLHEIINVLTYFIDIILRLIKLLKLILSHFYTVGASDISIHINGASD